MASAAATAAAGDNIGAGVAGVKGNAWVGAGSGAGMEGGLVGQPGVVEVGAVGSDGAVSDLIRLFCVTVVPLPAGSVFALITATAFCTVPVTEVRLKAGGGPTSPVELVDRLAG